MRLLRDRRGNALVMMAAMLIPLCALGGSAIDVARLYFVRARLQQACDAGALAGRKFMDGTDYNATAQGRATVFFNNNFRSGMFGSGAPTFGTSKTNDNQVAGTASVSVPMTMMKMFGFQPVTLNVVCQAKLEIPNLDVMFVLDTTGSMNTINSGDTVSRISALRTAVSNFYDTLEAAKKTGTQIRYGFVPYSTNVNVGMLLKRDWFADNWTYQSRRAVSVTSSPGQTDWIWEYGAYSYVSGTLETTTWQTSEESCTSSGSITTSPNTQTFLYSEAHGSDTWYYYRRDITQNGTQISYSRSNGYCNYTKSVYTNYKQTRTEIKKPGPGATTNWNYTWSYEQRTLPVSGYKGSASNGLMAGGTVDQVDMAFNTNAHEKTTQPVTWNASNACIEERKTYAITDYNNIDYGQALDLAIDGIPSGGNDESKWKPALNGAEYIRNTSNFSTAAATSGSGASFVCPSAARKLATITKGNLTSYLNGLKVDGKTYHDIGILWGARLISPTGLFTSENSTAPNGGDISRHIIFMTDGQTETDRTQYDAYGLSALDRRRTPNPSTAVPTDAQQDTVVANRLGALCTAIKNKNITVWVIAFGTDLTPMLSNCASPGKGYQASNAAELNTAFANIAKQIAKLRVSK